MGHRVQSLASALILVATTLVAPVVLAAPANAADDCGSDWYKESDGYLTKGPTSFNLSPTRSVTAWHEGRARFCTKNNFWDDDENRKVVVGTTPNYEVTSHGRRDGRLASWCVTQHIAVKVKNGKSRSQVGVSAGTDTSVSMTVSTDDVYVHAKQKSCGRRARTHVLDMANLRVTGPSGSRIPWIRQTTTLRGSYWANGDKRTFTRYLKEYDYS